MLFQVPEGETFYGSGEMLKSRRMEPHMRTSARLLAAAIATTGLMTVGSPAFASGIDNSSTSGAVEQVAGLFNLCGLAISIGGDAEATCSGEAHSLLGNVIH
jgi:hypothetical protein